MAVDFAGRLKEAMERRGLTAYAVARAADLDATTVYKILSGPGLPNIETASKIAHALDLTTSELLGERQTIILEETAELALARRAANSFAALKLEDPVEFLAALASLSEDDQAEIEGMVQLKLRRQKRAAPAPGSAEEELRRPRTR